MPTSAATARAVAALSPVRRTGRRPSRSSAATASRDVGLTASATASTPRADPLPGDRRRCARPSVGRRRRSAGDRDPAVGQQRRAPDQHRAAADHALDAEAGVRGEARDRRQRRRGGLRDRRATGCSDAASSAPAKRRTSSASSPRGGDDLREPHPAGGHRAGLVEHDRVDAARGLEHLGTLDQQPELGAAAGADEQRGRGREPERARAGDDQHGDRGADRERGVLAGAEPEAERGGGEHDHDRHEHAGHAVGESLRGRLAGLRVGHEAADLGERGVRADARRADDQPPAGVDGRAGDTRRRAASRPASTRRSATTRRRPTRRARRRRRSRPSRPAGRRSGRRRRAARPGRAARAPSSSSSATSRAPSSSSAVRAAPARRLARASKYRPASMNTVTAEATSR